MKDDIITRTAEPAMYTELNPTESATHFSNDFSIQLETA